MSNKQLTILGVIAAVTLILATVQSYIAHRPVATPTGPTYLIQGLEPEMIERIELGGGDNPVLLERQDRQFVVTNKDSYPAQNQEINDLVTKCLDVQATELITKSAENHPDLEVTEDKARYEVKFQRRREGGSGWELLAGVVVGKSPEQGGGSYVRLVNSDEVYLADDIGWLKMSALDYIDKKLTEVKKDDIVQVTVNGPEGNYTIIKDPTGKAYLPDIPEGKKARENQVEQTFTALTNLNFSNVQAQSLAAKDLDFNITYLCALQDSVVYTCKLASKDNKYYVTCSAAFTDQTPIQKKQEVESQEELKKKEAKLLARDAAEAFAQKHQGWVYELDGWQGDKLTRKLSDLLEDVQEKDQQTKEEDQPAESSDSASSAPPKTAESASDNPDE